jgi:hypothetical protein
MSRFMRVALGFVSRQWYLMSAYHLIPQVAVYLSQTGNNTMNTQLISVPFHGQSLLATLVNDTPYVAMKPICENIGVDWKSQHRKITTHPVLSKGMVMVTTPSNGGLQEMLMLPVNFVNGWLFGIDSNRVKPEIRDRLIAYQSECFEVLARHFMPKANKTAGNTQLADFLSPITEPITLEDFNWRKEVICRAVENLKKSQVSTVIIISGEELLAGQCFEK